MNLPPMFLAIAVLVSLGCSSSPKSFGSYASRALVRSDEQIFIDDTLEKNSYPHVIMKRAESFFEKEGYPEAIIEYQHFLELHRTHGLASYALYKIGESYFKQIKSIDRDPDPIYKALEAFEKLRKDYPGNRWDVEAQKRVRACHEYIAQQYLLVGQFYYQREAYLAAAHRFETVLNEFPDLDVAGDALYYLALTYRELGAENWAREKLLLLADRYPNNQHSAAGQKLLAKLKPKAPTSPIARVEASSMIASREEPVLQDVVFSLAPSPR